MSKATDVFWKRILRFPPILIRLLARHPHGAPLTTQEIAIKSGLNPMVIETLSQATDWTGVDLPTFQRFIVACGGDITQYQVAHRMENYLRGNTNDGKHTPVAFSYLKKHPAWASYYYPMLCRFYRSRVT